MKKLALHWKIIIGMAFGVLFATLSSWLGWSKFTLDWIDPFGVIFLRMLKLIAVPLVLFSIIAGVSGLADIRKIGRIGGKTLGMYLVTTVFAVSLGLLLVNVINPGGFLDDDTLKSNRINYEIWAAKNNVELVDDKKLWDGMSEDGYKEVTNDQVQQKQGIVEKEKEKGPLQPLVDMVPDNVFVSLTDNGLMLQVIFFGIFFGITLALIDKEKAGPLIKFVDGVNEVFLKMVDLVMQGAPFFVFALIAGVVSKLAGDDPAKVLEIFKGLSVYSLVVVLGLMIMIFLVYPGLVILFSKKLTYRQFFKSMAPAQLMAFSTSSSAATLPVTIECVNENLKVSKEVSSFVLPIGATVNMDGTSLYQAVAVIFLAQFHMIDLSLGAQLTIILTATLASIGSAAVPSAGLIMLMIVLESVGLNPAWIAIIFPVDRILDMCRTVVNVTGDATVSTIIASTEGQLGDHRQ
ncbi:MAG: dicarboxylate/amino acid:cation symporter [Bacteroidia bacterium]|nr:dicarboxylate/amino acid:cation symporter [Bacteroidia bacterium]